MACESRVRSGQTRAERKIEFRKSVENLSKGLASGQVKAVVDKRSGAIAFAGWNERNDVTDACGLRAILATGSTMAKLAIQKAEMLAGRQVDRKAQMHSHNGGESFHHNH